MKMLFTVFMFLLTLNCGWKVIKGILTIWRHGPNQKDEFPENLAFFCVLLMEFSTLLQGQTVKIPHILILMVGMYWIGGKIKKLILNRRAKLEL